MTAPELGLAPLKAYGFAPGSYMCFCSECGVQHTADKRAWRCLSCAEKLADLCIRRDDPALRQVMDVLEGIGRTYAANRSRLIHSDTQIKAMADSALANMQKLIGGKDKKTP